MLRILKVNVTILHATVKNISAHFARRLNFVLPLLNLFCCPCLPNCMH